MNKIFLFCNKFISYLYMFRLPCVHRQEVKIALHSLWYHHTETSEWSKITKIQTHKYEQTVLKFMCQFFGCDCCVLLTINMLCHVEVMFIQLLNLLERYYVQLERTFCAFQISCLNLCLLTYKIPPWSRVLLEKLTVCQLVNNLPAFCGTRIFITAFTSAHQVSLS